MSATFGCHALFPDLMFVFWPHIESLTKRELSRSRKNLNRVKTPEKAHESRRQGKSPMLYLNSTERRHRAISFNQPEVKDRNAGSVFAPQFYEFELLLLLTK